LNYTRDSKRIIAWRHGSTHGEQEFPMTLHEAANSLLMRQFQA